MATSVQALSDHVHAFNVGKTLIQSGSHQKSVAGGYSVSFRSAYASPPVVVLTPFWSGHNAQLAGETVNTISATDFTGFSENAAPDYFVEWIAIGKAE